MPVVAASRRGSSHVVSRAWWISAVRSAVVGGEELGPLDLRGPHGGDRVGVDELGVDGGTQHRRGDRPHLVTERAERPRPRACSRMKPTWRGRTAVSSIEPMTGLMSSRTIPR